MARAGDRSWSFLSGVRVIECAALLPGPYATCLLADLGADVIKVEPLEGDPGRKAPLRFAAVNRNKRSIVLDLKQRGDRDLFMKLARTADAVVEGFRPGVADRLGIGWPVLQACNPQLVFGSITGYGQDGPYAGRPGHDLNFLSLSGFFAVPARVDGAVTRPGVRVADLVGGLYAALSLATAIASARCNGRGQRLDIALVDAVTACFSPSAFALPSGLPATESELVMGDNDIFETADRKRLALATTEDKFWLNFRSGLLDEFSELRTEAFDERRHRTAARIEVGRLLQSVFRQREFGWWSNRLTQLDVPWTPVHDSPASLLHDASANARHMFDEGVVDEDGTAGVRVRFPTRFELGLDSSQRLAPRLGAHTAELIQELSSINTQL